MDPDKFPINRLSGDLIKEFDDLWSSEKGKAMIKELETYVGHTLEVKPSSIDHHMAGDGVFVSCKR